MYIWELEMEERWNWDKKEWNNYNGTMFIAAKSFDEAIKKASDKLMKGTKPHKDDAGNLCVLLEVRPLRVERKDKLDA